MTRFRNSVLGLVVLLVAGAAVSAEEKPRDNQLSPAAILPFSERGKASKELGPQVAALLFANLVEQPGILLVDRQDLDKTLAEMEIGLSGIVTPAEAARVGQVSGAKILITGSIIDVEKTRYLVAKIISTETTRVLGASVKGTTASELDTLVETLAGKIAAIIAERGSEILPKEVTATDYVTLIKKALKGKYLPTVSVDIPERHVGQMTIDPAAETELLLLFRETGFTVLDGKTATAKPDIKIVGEAFSELAKRRGDLVAVKARLEIKAIDTKTGKIVAAERQVSIAVDLAEQIAGKAALQQASAEIARRLLPKLARTPDTQQ